MKKVTVDEHWVFNFFLRKRRIEKSRNVRHGSHCGFVFVTHVCRGHLPPEGYWGRTSATKKIYDTILIIIIILSAQS